MASTRTSGVRSAMMRATASSEAVSVSIRKLRGTSVRHLHRGAHPFVEGLGGFAREQSDTPYSSLFGKLAQLLVDKGVVKADSGCVRPGVTVVIARQPGPIDRA